MTSSGHTEAGPGLPTPSNHCPRVQSKALTLGSNTSVPLKCALQDVQGRQCLDRALWSPIRVILDWHAPAVTARMQRRGSRS